MIPKTFNLARSQNVQAQSIFNDLKSIYSTVVTVDATTQNLYSVLNTIINVNLLATPTAMYVSVDSDNLTDKVVRYTIDGTTPDPATFHGIAKRDSDEFLITEYHNIERFRWTEESANTTTMYITFLTGLQ